MALPVLFLLSAFELAAFDWFSVVSFLAFQRFSVAIYQ
jgi:hypothetical protein